MNPMSDWLAFTLVTLGTALNLFGLYCGGKAFVAAWRKYGDGDLWPWIRKTASAARAVGRRIAFWRRRDTTVFSVSGSAHAATSASAYVTARPGFPDTDHEEQRYAQLQRAIEMAFDQMLEDRSRANRQNAEFEKRLSEIKTQVEGETRRLEDLSKEIASGDVRLQLLGLMAIGFGTVLLALPSIWNMLAAMV